MGRLGQAHILLATLGVAVFAFAAVLAIVYLFQDRSLKRKQLERVMARGTPLETLDRLAHRCVSIGFPVFTLAIVTGAIWVARLGLLHGRGTLRPEYLLAVGTWVAFAVLLVARVGAGWRGRRAAWLTLGGFGGTALVVGGLLPAARGVDDGRRDHRSAARRCLAQDGAGRGARAAGRRARRRPRGAGGVDRAARRCARR